jgi:hypothetical protein
LRLFVGVSFILIGSILIGLTIDNISTLDNIVMKLLGASTILFGVLYARKRKGYYPTSEYKSFPRENK